tara:strand:- start:548 stop:715 length:168 start_codon:yes stop_codon:yes gene_type:complete
MQIKTDKETSYQTFLDELMNQMEEQANFVSDTLQFICGCGMLDKVQDSFFLSSQW